MGSASSKTNQELNNLIDITISQTCPKQTSTQINKNNTITLGNVTNCKNVGLIANETTVDQDCVYDAILNHAQTLAAANKTIAESHLFQDTSVDGNTTLTNQVKQFFDNKCGEQNITQTLTDNIINIGDVIDCENIGKIINNTYGKSACAMGTLTKVIQDAEAENDSEATGETTSPFSALTEIFGGGGGIGMTMIIVAIVFIAVVLFM